MFSIKPLVIVGLAVCSAFGQSFNVDFDMANPSSAPYVGGPSSSYGAAAGQPGVWNLRQAPSAQPLVDVAGAPTGAAITWCGGSFSGAAVLTGDFGKLMGDITYALGPCDYTFSGLQPGKYRVYTYSWNAGVPTQVASVSVVGSTGPAQAVGGTVLTAPNTFTQGITHAVHDVVTTTGVIVVHTDVVVGVAVVNGIQLVRCPGGFGVSVHQATVGSGLDIEFTCGAPGLYYLLGASFVPGAFPFGPFFGITPDATLLSYELAHGPPVFGALDAAGNAFGTFPGPIMSNITLYLVGISANSNASVVMSTAPFVYTTL